MTVTWLLSPEFRFVDMDWNPRLPPHYWAGLRRERELCCFINWEKLRGLGWGAFILGNLILCEEFFLVGTSLSITSRDG